MRRSLLASFGLLTLISSLAIAERTPSRFPPATLAKVLHSRPVHPLATPGGQIPITVKLRPGESASSLGLLEVAPGIGAKWVDPTDLDSFLEKQKERRPWVTPPLRLLSDVAGESWTHAHAAHAKGRKGKGVVIGIMDTGIDLTHPDLRTEQGETRVAWLLDLANQPTGIHADLETQFGCNLDPRSPCAIFSAADLDKITAGKIDGIIPPSDVVGHGTHVAGLAAGNGDGSAGRKYIGVAPDATLIAVRVTRSAAGNSVTDADLLNAVRFVFDRAKALGMPAVVNISLGGDYGPHDGTSPLEEGLAAFIGPSHPGRAIVVAAGNSGGVLFDPQGQSYGPHTEARSLDRSKTRLTLTMPAATKLARGSAFVWITFQPGDTPKVSLEWNGGQLLGPYSRGEQGAVEEGENHPYLAIIHGVVNDTSPISPRTNSAIVVADGSFHPGDKINITLEGNATAQLWVQGIGDAEFGSTTGGMLFLNPLKQGTINVPATHPSLLSVGCTINRLQWPTLTGPTLVVTQLGSLKDPPGDSICYFSGAGPNALGTLKPEIAAPGAFIAAAMSRDANPASNRGSIFYSPASRCGAIDNCNVVDEHHAISSGTSMSAPQVAGAVALLLEQKANLTQPEITALLQAGSRRFEGVVPSDSQSGPGALDIDTSLEMLSPTIPKEPSEIDEQRSWLHLSSEFLRPDGQWPVIGTLLLRDRRQQPTDGLDPTRIHLEISGATIAKPLTRVAEGLWQFTLIARPGTGGSYANIRATVAGRKISERTLPIAVDRWNVDGSIETHGGCSR